MVGTLAGSPTGMVPLYQPFGCSQIASHLPGGSERASQEAQPVMAVPLVNQINSWSHLARSTSSLRSTTPVRSAPRACKNAVAVTICLLMKVADTLDTCCMIAAAT